ncbi:MAG: proline/glycine betaine ABC transporter permease, partial [Leucothrix sp.]
MAWYDFFTTVPEMERQGLRDFKKGIDGSFRDFSREFGESLENFFDPVLFFLVWLEKLLLATPWPIIILIVAGLAW